jgi:hypothetical protein
MNVTDRRFGRSFVAARDIAVFIPGERRATIRVVTRQAGVEAGSGFKVSVNIANSGTGTWAGSWAMDAGAGTMNVDRGTRAIGRWIRLADDGTAFEGKTPKPVTFVLAEVPLEAGEIETLHEVITAPETLGRWAFVVDVVDDVDGSYAAMGSEPGVVYVDVVAPRGRDDAE